MGAEPGSGALPPPTEPEQAWLDAHPAPPLSAEQSRRTGVLLRAGREKANRSNDIGQAS